MAIIKSSINFPDAIGQIVTIKESPKMVEMKSEDRVFIGVCIEEKFVKRIEIDGVMYIKTFTPSPDLLIPLPNWNDVACAGAENLKPIRNLQPC